jgi:hypothetical protein
MEALDFLQPMRQRGADGGNSLASYCGVKILTPGNRPKSRSKLQILALCSSDKAAISGRKANLKVRCCIMMQQPHNDGEWRHSCAAY